MGYFHKLDLPTDMPMGSEKPASFTTVSGSQYANGTVDVVLPHNGSCLVTGHLDVAAVATNSTGLLSFKTARLDVATATNGVDNGWYMDIPVPSRLGSGSATYTWSMTGGKTYRFGCYFHSTVDFIGETVYPNVSWICR